MTNNSAIAILRNMSLWNIINGDEYNAIKMAINALGEKKGHWIDHQMGRWIYAKCSECGTVWDVKSNFCPNCGCRMKEGE